MSLWRSLFQSKRFLQFECARYCTISNYGYSQRLPLIVLAVVDYKKRFIDVEAGWPGSVGDGRVWRNSALHRRHKEWLSQFACTPLQIGIREEDGDVISEDIPTFILADSAYPNTKHMVTTFKTTECADPVINALNQKLGGARYHVQNAFGILKARFQIF